MARTDNITGIEQAFETYGGTISTVRFRQSAQYIFQNRSTRVISISYPSSPSLIPLLPFALDFSLSFCYRYSPLPPEWSKLKNYYRKKFNREKFSPDTSLNALLELKLPKVPICQVHEDCPEPAYIKIEVRNNFIWVCKPYHDQITGFEGCDALIRPGDVLSGRCRLYKGHEGAHVLENGVHWNVPRKRCPEKISEHGPQCEKREDHEGNHYAHGVEWNYSDVSHEV